MAGAQDNPDETSWHGERSEYSSHGSGRNLQDREYEADDDSEAHDYLVEDLRGANLHLAMGSEMNLGPTPYGAGTSAAIYPTQSRSTASGERIPALFSYGHHDLEGLADQADLNARGTSVDENIYASDIPSSLPSLHDPAGNLLPDSYYVGASTESHPTGFDDRDVIAYLPTGIEPTYNQEFTFADGHSRSYVQPHSSSNAYRPNEQQYQPHRAPENVGYFPLWGGFQEQPWNHLRVPGTQVTQSGYTFNHAPQQTSPSIGGTASDLVRRGSGRSSRSNGAAPETSTNTSSDILDPALIDSMATLRPPIVNHQGRAAVDRYDDADTASWTSYHSLVVPGSGSIGSVDQPQMPFMRGQTSPSSLTAPDVPQSRQRSPSLRHVASNTHATGSDVSSCPHDHCSATFRGTYARGSLHRHMRLNHNARGENGKMAYLCEGCEKAFRRQDARLKHYRSRHPDLNPPAAIPRKVQDQQHTSSF